MKGVGWAAARVGVDGQHPLLVQPVLSIAGFSERLNGVCRLPPRVTAAVGSETESAASRAN